MKTRIALIALLSLLACGRSNEKPPGEALVQDPLPAPIPALAPQQAARNFSAVVARMEPVIEAECVKRLVDTNCDFKISVDPTAGAPANAYQALDANGRPTITFTLALVAQARNPDEIAFVLGHEAAHHILQHIARQQHHATMGAAVTGVMAAALGGNGGTVRTIQKVGARVSAGSYSKEYELEADKMGTVLAYQAGFDPLVGAAFFNRLPDPSDEFLGSHPPNANRMELVRQTLLQLRGY